MSGPKGDRVLVQKLNTEHEVKLESGIILTSEAIDGMGRQPIGLVTAVGPGVKETAVGEVVVYQRYGGTEIRLEGVEYTLFRESEILMGLNDAVVPVQD